MPPLSQYSEPALDPMWFAIWCYVVAWLVIIIICIECPPRFVRLWTIWCNKCGISLLGLLLCITFKFSLRRGRFTSHARYYDKKNYKQPTQSFSRNLASLILEAFCFTFRQGSRVKKASFPISEKAKAFDFLFLKMWNKCAFRHIYVIDHQGPSDSVLNCLVQCQSLSLTPLSSARLRVMLEPSS